LILPARLTNVAPTRATSRETNAHEHLRSETPRGRGHGGNGGIGLGIAQALAAAGCTVSILGRNPDKNRQALVSITGAGGRKATRWSATSPTPPRSRRR